jgi:hypothetical protein
LANNVGLGSVTFACLGGAGAHEREFLGGQVAALVQPGGHRQVRGPFDGGVTHLIGMPPPPQPGIEADPAEPVAGRSELRLKRLPPHLPIVDDRQVQLILQCHGLPHRAVLSRLEPGRAKFTSRIGGTGIMQERRAQQAPDMFHTGGYCHHPSIPPHPGQSGTA